MVLREAERGTKEMTLRERESSRESSREGEFHPLSLRQLYTVSTEGRSSR